LASLVVSLEAYRQVCAIAIYPVFISSIYSFHANPKHKPRQTPFVQIKRYFKHCTFLFMITVQQRDTRKRGSMSSITPSVVSQPLGGTGIVTGGCGNNGCSSTTTETMSSTAAFSAAGGVAALENVVLDFISAPRLLFWLAVLVTDGKLPVALPVVIWNR
jgi:hypothetical protein